jgi:hypothetical protein
MSNWLQTAANIIQIVGVGWTILLGGKTIFDLRKQQNQQLTARGPFPWSLLINALSFVIIIVLLCINIILLHANSNGTPFNPSTPSHSPAASATPSHGAPLPSSPLPTASSGGHAYNIQLTCSKGSCVNDLQMTLVYSTVDVAKKLVVLTFTILNTSEVSSYESDAGTEPSSVTLQSALDESPYSGYEKTQSGSTQKGIPFLVNAGQRIQVTIDFDFVPRKAVSYQLLVDMTLYIAYPVTFDPVSLTF